MTEDRNGDKIIILPNGDIYKGQLREGRKY